jgi:hypothetical protein
LGHLTAILLDRHRLEDWSYGRLHYRDRYDEYQELGWGFLTRVTYVWVLVVDASLDLVQEKARFLTWASRGNLGNYVRRFEAIERQLREPSYAVQLLAARTTGLQPKTQTDRGQAVGTPTYGKIAQMLDPDQLKVVRAALLNKGIVLARGPYGCG